MSADHHAQVGHDDLIIPIYIDTNVLLDLLASIEDGFSVVEKITTRNASSRVSEASAKADAGTEFGIPNVLNLLKINLGGSFDRKHAQEAGQEREAVRYHTYGSLLHRLRGSLMDRGMVKQFDGTNESWTNIEAQDFVEFRGTFRPNPMADSIGTIERLMGLFQLFAAAQANQGGPRARSDQPAQRGGPNKSGSPLIQPSQNEILRYRSFFQGILADLEKKDIRLVVIDLHDSPKHRAVASLFTEYLRDQSTSELSHKEYRLFGRVVGKVSHPNESIDLLQGTALGGVGEQVISDLTDHLNQMQGGINLPKAETRITAPAVQVLPIAIYA